MTPHQFALILRLAAATIDDEPYSVRALRRILLAEGWTDSALTSAVEGVRRSLSSIAPTQGTLFDPAA